MNHYFFLNSQDSKLWFPNNSNYNFRIKLPASLKLEGKWKCALTELSFTPEFSGEGPRDIYICCDIVQESYAGNSTLPVLRRINISPSTSNRIQVFFPQNLYIDISQEEIQYIHIYIKDQDLQEPSFGRDPFTCTLHICKSQ